MKQPTQSCSLEQPKMLAKINLYFILKEALYANSHINIQILTLDKLSCRFMKENLEIFDTIFFSISFLSRKNKFLLIFFSNSCS